MPENRRSRTTIAPFLVLCVIVIFTVINRVPHTLSILFYIEWNMRVSKIFLSLSRSRFSIRQFRCFACFRSICSSHTQIMYPVRCIENQLNWQAFVLFGRINAQIVNNDVVFRVINATYQQLKENLSNIFMKTYFPALLFHLFIVSSICPFRFHQ